MADTVETAIYRLQVEGQEKIDALKKSLDGLSVSEERSTNSTRTSSAALQTMLGKFDPIIKAQNDYAKALDRIQRYDDAGIGSQKELAALYEGATQKFNAQTAAVKNLGDAHEGMTNQAQSAFHAVRSFGEQIAMGVPVTQALTSQINHLTYAASGEGGLVGAFKQVASAGVGALGFLLNPVTATIAAVGALGAALGYVALQYDKVQKAANLSTIGAGARTGTSVEDQNQFVAQTSKSTSPLNLSDKEARALGESLTATGDIVIGTLHGMSDAVIGFSQLTGKSVDEASKAWVKFATEPQKALDELGQTFGAFDENTRKAVDAAVEAGDKTKALQTIVDALSQKTRAAADNMGMLDKVWRSLKLPELVVPQGLDTQLKAAEEALARMQEDAGAFGNEIDATNKKIAELKLRIADAETNKLAEQFNNVATQIELATKEQERMLPVVSAVGGEARMAAQYAADYSKAVDDGKSSVVAAAIATANWANAQAQVNAQAKETLFNLQNQAQVAAAVTEQQKIQAQAIAQKNALLREGVDAVIAEQVATQQAANARAEATANVRKQVDALKDSTAMIKAEQNGTEASTAAAIAYKNAIASGADATAAAALKAATLANYMAKSASSAQSFLQSMYGAAQATSAAQAGVSAFLPMGLGGLTPFQANGPQGGGSDTNTHPGSAFSGTSAFGSYTQTPISSSYSASTSSGGGLSNGGVSNALLAWDAISGGAFTGGGATTSNSVTQLSNSIDSLKTSTDSLNTTMQEALSPYYSQDPRTSHIGFRSQGMASGGYVDVPGSPSANDNLMAMIPVASGERIYVDPMTSKRGGGSGTSNTTININVPITIAGNANKDEVGRTVYQAMQAASKRLAASQR